MATPKSSKFIRPEAGRLGPITDRDLDILDAVLRYRFCSAAQIVRLAGGNEDVTHRRLRRLWKRGLVTHWAFPGFRTHREFYHYLDTREPLDLLAERRRLEIHPQMLEEMRSHREKDCAGAAVRGQHMQLGFLNHGLMISRMHFIVEMACGKSGGEAVLEAWCQGGQIAYEADRGTMVMTDMLNTLRGYHHFIKRQQRHKEAFGVHSIRAVLVETVDEARGRRLMELAAHPLICGAPKRAGLFWFTISPLFTNRAPAAERAPSDRALPRYLVQPDIILLGPIWALPDGALHALGDIEDSPQSQAPSNLAASALVGL